MPKRYGVAPLAQLVICCAEAMAGVAKAASASIKRAARDPKPRFPPPIPGSLSDFKVTIFSLRFHLVTKLRDANTFALNAIGTDGWRDNWITKAIAEKAYKANRKG